MKRSFSVLLAFWFMGCGFVNEEDLTGPYRLIAVDADQEMAVCYGLPDGNAIERIPGTVFSVGWDDRYIVAKQHPNNDRRITNFFYLDMSKDTDISEPAVSVTGPMAESEFLRKKTELKLPDFTRTLRNLE